MKNTLKKHKIVLLESLALHGNITVIALCLQTTPADIDECVQQSPCDQNATCTNTPGSFTCVCNEGYTGDGTTCTGVLLPIAFVLIEHNSYRVYMNEAVCFFTSTNYCYYRC